MTDRWNGFVEVVFTVSAQGEVVDARVQRTNLSQAFQNEALRAVRTWHFRPDIEADAAQQRRYSVRIDFKANEASVKQSSTP
jgi:periplasmic protein TonB